MNSFVLEEVADLDPETGCWLWKGATTSHGYGALEWEGRTRAAHIVSYLVHKGEIPKGMVCRHTCDVRRCVDPNHLVLGTKRDNSRDMVERGRSASGDRSGSRRHPERLPRGDRHWTKTATDRSSTGRLCKLDDETAKAVKEGLMMGILPMAMIAKLVGVSRSTIAKIAQGKLWAHVQPDPVPKAPE